MSEHEIDFYAYKLPIMVLLAANTFFLVWIMVVSVYNTMTLYLDHEAITLKKLTCWVEGWGLGGIQTLKRLNQSLLLPDCDIQAEVPDPHHGPWQETLQGGQGKAKKYLIKYKK